MDQRDVTLAVLAGGRGERMGGPKSALRIGGVSILRYLLGRLAWDGPTLLVSGVGNERPVAHELFDAEVTDAVADQGPLRGILTALDGARTPLVAVVTVDMPGVGREQIEWLVERIGRVGAVAMVSRLIDGVARVEPFPCVLRASAREMVARRLEARRRSVHAMEEEAGVEIFRAPESWREGVWVNLNLPGDLATFNSGEPPP